MDSARNIAASLDVSGTRCIWPYRCRDWYTSWRWRTSTTGGGSRQTVVVAVWWRQSCWPHSTTNRSSKDSTESCTWTLCWSGLYLEHPFLSIPWQPWSSVVGGFCNGSNDKMCNNVWCQSMNLWTGKNLKNNIIDILIHGYIRYFFNVHYFILLNDLTTTL